MFGYEHERVCFARIGECDGGMSATIVNTSILETFLCDSNRRLYGCRGV